MSYLKNIPKGILVFGAIEILIGSSTLVKVTADKLQGANIAPHNVLLFIVFTASLSLVLGVGIIARSVRAYRLLMFFAVLIIVSKVLIFTQIIRLNDVLVKQEAMLPFKDAVSSLYHMLLVWYLNRRGIKSCFGA